MSKKNKYKCNNCGAEFVAKNAMGCSCGEPDIVQIDEKKKFVYPTDDEFDEVSFDELKDIIKHVGENPDTIKEQSMKDIKIFGNKIVKIKFKCDAIEKGISMIKGYKAKCKECGDERILYNKFIKNSSDMCGCMSYGSRGGEKECKLDKRPINDTGIMCLVSDQLDNGHTQSQEDVFFGLDMLQKKGVNTDELEKLLATESFSATCVIRTSPGKDMISMDKFFDIIDFEIYTKEYVYDLDKIKILNAEKRDDKFFDVYFAPAIYKRTLSKKIDALLLCQPHRILLPNGEEDISAGSNITLGDQGLAKTKLSEYGYSKYTETPIVSAGLGSRAGLVGGATPGKSGKYILSVGRIPKQHMRGITIDEAGKQTQEEIAGVRTIESDGKLVMSFCGIAVDIDCLVNKNIVGNTKFNVSKYPTKHRASYDLAIGENDQSKKFSGADRRRKNHVVVVANSDMKTADVANRIMSKKTGDFNDFEFWNNLNQFAWSRKPEHIKWKVETSDIIKDVLKLNSEYEDFELEYGVLGKGGIKVFTRQLPAVAILHGSIDGELVIVKKEHVTWLRELYDDEFDELGLKQEKKEKEIHMKHCEKIIENCTPDILNILKLISKYGSQSAVEKSGEMTRMTMYRHLKAPVEYSVKIKKTGEVIKKYYSFTDGSVVPLNTEYQYSSNNKIPAFSKKDGTISFFGMLILEHVNNNEEELEEIE